MKRAFLQTFVIVFLLGYSDFVANPSRLFAGPPEGSLAMFGKSRTWSDPAGKFKIEASLADANSSEVRLKRADGKINVVQLNKLCDADQAYVRAFLDAEAALRGGGSAGSGDNPFTVVNDAAMSSASSGKPTTPSAPNDGQPSKDDPNGFKPVPLRKFNVKSVATFPIDWEKAHWKGSPVTPIRIPVGQDSITQVPLKKDFWEAFQLKVAGAKPQVFANIYRQGRGEDENYSRLGGVRLPDGEPKLLSAAKTPWKIMAVSPDARRIAAVHIEGFDVGGRVAIWDIVEDKVDALYQFQVGGSWDEVTWARFIHNDRLVTITKKGTLTFWDLAEKRATQRLAIQGITDAAVGGRGDLVALPGPGRVAFIKGESGRQVGLVMLDGQATPSLAFSDDGQSVAAYTPHNVDIIRLTDGSIAQSIPVMVNGERAAISWVGNYVLLDNHLLIDVQLGCPIWDYPSSHGILGHAVWAGQLFAIFEGKDQASMVNVALPHLQARNAAAALEPSQMYAIVKGSTLTMTASLDGMTEQQQARAKGALEQRLTQLGYKFTFNAPYTIHLELKRLPEVEEEFVIVEGRGPFGMMPPSFFGSGPSGPVEKVRYSPWYQSITITARDEVVYKKEIRIQAGNGMSLKEGENAQAAVSRHVVPNVEFFAGATLPARILRPELQNGLGKTTISGNGLQ